MEVFKLQQPIASKIKSFVDERDLDPLYKLDSSKVMYFDYQPDEGFVSADIWDGAIAVYASEISFPPSSGSNTEEQSDDSMITIDVYGFGDPVETGVDPNVYSPTVREAQRRAEVLITLAYQAVMDRRELKGSPSENIPKMFGSGVDVGVDKYPVSLRKFENVGTTQSKRGLVAYRLIIKFRLQELTRQEALGVLYDGSDNIESDTFNPPTT